MGNSAQRTPDSPFVFTPDGALVGGTIFESLKNIPFDPASELPAGVPMPRNGSEGPLPPFPFLPNERSLSVFHDLRHVGGGEYGNLSNLDVIDLIETDYGDEVEICGLGFPVTDGQAWIDPPFVMAAARFVRPVVRVVREQYPITNATVRARGRALDCRVRDALVRGPAFRAHLPDGREIRYMDGVCGVRTPN